MTAVLTGTAGLTKTGGGVLAHRALITILARTTILAGTLQADDGVGLPSGSNLTLNGGVLKTGRKSI